MYGRGEGRGTGHYGYGHMGGCISACKDLDFGNGKEGTNSNLTPGN